MDVKDFYFDLPQELIAQDPLEDRSSSRLMILDKETGKTEHHVFREIIDELNPGDCLVINDTKVIPARLIGAKEDTGAKIEVLLLKRGADDVWETLVKPGKKARPGARISFGDGLLVGEVMDVVEEGNRLIHFEYEGIFEENIPVNDMFVEVLYEFPREMIKQDIPKEKLFYVDAQSVVVNTFHVQEIIAENKITDSEIFKRRKQVVDIFKRISFVEGEK